MPGKDRRLRREAKDLRRRVHENVFNQEEEVVTKELTNPPKKDSYEPLIGSERFIQLPEAHQLILREVVLGMAECDEVIGKKQLDRSVEEAFNEKISLGFIGDAMIEGIHNKWSSKEHLG